MERTKRDTKRPRRLSPPSSDKRKPSGFKVDDAVARECEGDEPGDEVAPVDRLLQKYNADAGSDWSSVRYAYKCKGVTCKAYRAFTLVTTTKLPRTRLDAVKVLWNQAVGPDVATVTMPLGDPQAIVVSVKAYKTDEPYNDGPDVPVAPVRPVRPVPSVPDESETESEPVPAPGLSDLSDVAGPSRPPTQDALAQMLAFAKAFVEQHEPASLKDAPTVKEADVLGAALDARKERFNTFLESSMYKEMYMNFVHDLSGAASDAIDAEMKLWRESGKQAPASRDAFVPMLKGLMKPMDKKSKEYNDLDLIVGRCKKWESKLYCGKCRKPATCVPLTDWVAFHKDRRFEAALRGGCYQASHVMNMFKGYSHAMSAEAPVAFCAKCVTPPYARFDHTSNRTCMCCMENSIGGNVGNNDKSVATCVYWLCGECTQKCNGRSDGSVRIGIMEDVVTRGLEVYAHLATALFPDVIVSVRQQVPIHDAGPVDIGIDAKFAEDKVMRHYVEINGDGHNLVKDLKTKMRMAFDRLDPQKTSKAKMVWWAVRVYKNCPEVVEVVRQNWLRIHCLSVKAGFHHVPDLQVVLVNVSDIEVQNVRDFLDRRITDKEQAKQFMDYNLHVITGVPSPATGLSPRLRLLFQHRDVVSKHGEFSPIRTVWDWNVWDNKVGASRQGAARMKIPVCTPPSMREAEMDLPDVLPYGHTVRHVSLKATSPPP